MLSTMASIIQPTELTINETAEILRVGSVVAFPTETVYGLGGDTFNTRAMEKIYTLKGRPSTNPLIAHVLDSEEAKTRLTTGWDSRCDELVDRFWPGPLTLILNKRDEVPEAATAGLKTIAVRSPLHEVARKLLKTFGSAISAPSANRSGHVSPTCAEHVCDDFPDHPELQVLDGGPCKVGIESTVLDMTTDIPTILRSGSVTKEQLQEVLGEVNAPSIKEQAASPGTTLRHYAPTTKTILVESKELKHSVESTQDTIALLLSSNLFESLKGMVNEKYCVVMPSDPVGYAAKLYESLRKADDMNTDVIVIEKPSHSVGLWGPIQDRLQRASSF